MDEKKLLDRLGGRVVPIIVGVFMGLFVVFIVVAPNLVVMLFQITLAILLVCMAPILYLGIKERQSRLRGNPSIV